MAEQSLNRLITRGFGDLMRDGSDTQLGVLCTTAIADSVTVLLGALLIARIQTAGGAREV